MILLLDNYDSFTYNLLHYIGELGAEVEVRRNDAVTMEDIRALKPEGIVISPGPGTPDDAGICMDVIRDLGGDIPIFGVCLGHQCIGQVFGGKIVREAPMHGKVDEVTHQGKSVFKGLPSPLTATRYHSLIIKRQTLPDCLEITAENPAGIIMGVMHKELPVHGVQFHPESIASQYGHEMLKNFLEMCQEAVTA